MRMRMKRSGCQKKEKDETQKQNEDGKERT